MLVFLLFAKHSGHLFVLILAVKYLFLL